MVTEKQIQDFFGDYLRRIGFLVIRHTPIRLHGDHFCKVPDGEKGMPDHICCYRGHFVGIEYKRPGEKQSDWQVMRQLEIEKKGGYYLLIDDINNGQEKIKALKGALDENRCVRDVRLAELLGAAPQVQSNKGELFPVRRSDPPSSKPDAALCGLSFDAGHTEVE